MNRIQIAQLLTIASGLDGRVTVDDLVVEAWMEALDGVDYEDARSAIIAWYQRSDTKVMVSNIKGIIRERAEHGRRRNPSQIAEDVRDAKAFNLLPADWDAYRPLPPGVPEQLRSLRSEVHEFAYSGLAPKPENFEPMSAAHNNPDEFAHQVDVYNDQLIHAGFRPVNNTLKHAS